MVVGFGCATTPKEAAPVKAEETPDWMFHDIIDVAFVKQHVTIPMSQEVMLIDARPKRSKYDKGHIPMAVSIPDSQFEKMVDKLPQDKNTLLIYYCGGLKCPLSHKSAWKAEKLGYTNVKVFATGYPSWMKASGHYPSVSENWVKKQIDGNADMVLVDSRPKRKKYDKGHVPTAISIPDSQFDKLKDQLPKDKAKTLVFYCGGLKCPLSHKSAKKAIDLEYTNVKVFSAGDPAWKKVAGTPAETAAQAAPVQIKAGKEEGSIDVATFEKILKENPESILLIDVRDSDEYAAGAFKTAVNIPSGKLEDEIKSLPSNKPIVFVCATGARSGEAFYWVQDMRPELKDVYYIEAVITFNKDGSYKIVEPS
ncbi:MAG: rhodanese-like domain-containing protein [Desulfobacterales bacterium]|nr:MAG: rhodanese-like domain-containing protein [Desulfobacterales bacterium]